MGRNRQSSLPKGVKVLRYQRLTSPHGDRAHFALIERENIKHAFRINLGGSSSTGYNHLATGGNAPAVMTLMVKNTISNASGHNPDFSVETERLDSEGQRAVGFLFHPLFGVDWSKHSPEDEEDESAVELESFHKLLQRQVKEWKGSHNRFMVEKHSYWPIFRKMLDEALSKKYGSKVKLYRGVYGKYAGDIIQGGAIKIKRLTAWTLDSGEAKSFALHGGGGGGGGFRKGHWLVLRVNYPIANVIAAPVTLPNYKPDPNIYHAFKHESEVVVQDKRGTLPKGFYKIVSKSRSKLSTAERVELRYEQEIWCR